MQKPALLIIARLNVFLDEWDRLRLDRLIHAINELIRWDLASAEWPDGCGRPDAGSS
jgi:hypothetical protein